MSRSSSVVRGIAVLAALFLLSACGEAPTAPASPDAPSTAEAYLHVGPGTIASSTSSDDLTWGSNNVLQATDTATGTVYRIERFGSPGAWTHATFYADGVYQPDLFRV